MHFKDLDQNIKNDIVSWDIINWSRAFPFWEKFLPKSIDNKKCLELGGNSGGLSLWMAKNGGQCICSDLNNPKELSSKIHNKYDSLAIEYEAINALNIPYKEEFDIVAFKSILGGVSRGGYNKNKKEMITQIHSSLKKGGSLVFSENLIASPLHQFFRKKFVKWGNDWNYLSVNEVEDLFSNFDSFHFTTLGFFGAFGRTERQRNFLGRLDKLFDRIFSKRSHYIIVGVAIK